MADRRPILMLIDGPSLVYRGYFALPPLTMSDGTLVNAVFGFLQIVLRGMQDLKPDFAMLSFDVGRPQFRFDAYPEYKAGRPSMPDDLRAQFPIVREIAQMMNIPIRELEGYEADDVIGSLVQQGKRAGVDTYIVSGDLDGLQLVNDHVRLLTTRMGVAATVIYDEAKVMERYGLRPDQMLDYKALKGDTSDNIPGVPGVGEKTAIQLLQQFETLDALYERLDEVKGKLRDRLAEHRESAFMSREVGRIIIDLPVELNLDEGRTGRYDRRAVAQRFRELEFRTLIDRLPPSSIAPTGYGPAEQETAQWPAAVAGPAGWRAAVRGGGSRGRRRRNPDRSGPDPARRGERSRRGDRARRPADRAQRRRPGRPGDMADCPWRGRRAGLGGRRRAAAGAAAAGDRAGRRGRLHLVPAVERRPRRCPAGSVAPIGR